MPTVVGCPIQRYPKPESTINSIVAVTWGKSRLHVSAGFVHEVWFLIMTACAATPEQILDILLGSPDGRVSLLFAPPKLAVAHHASRAATFKLTPYLGISTKRHIFQSSESSTDKSRPNLYILSKQHNSSFHLCLRKFPA